jgi:hypothetical protein
MAAPSKLWITEPQNRRQVQNCGTSDRLRDQRGASREKSQPRNGAGEIFITAAAEIARETVFATNHFENETGNPRKFARK